ncbi:MAG TPA: cell wall-binding repeat-containing protein, partial [Nocardioidaceae bacterium]|nr:cell wall-binding repeat-containing protein [Nocardioidaceae bacterium]
MEEILSKSSNGLRKAGLASLAVTLTLGAGAMGAGAANAAAGFSFDRLGGEDRYETSTIVADEYAATNTDVILANAQPGFYADALTANFLAGEKEDPILLTRAEFTPKSVLAQLEEDGTKNITVVGGETVVPEEQVDALEAEGYTVTRIAGSDRYLTNAEVIEAGGAAVNGVGVIATGQNFPDALAAGPISYQGHPLGLSRENNIDDEVIAALKGAGVTKVLIMGGTDAVGAAVVAKLEANGITVLERFAGADRSETSELAAEWALKNLGFTNKHLGVASGYTKGYGADALAGGPLEGKEKSPMLVTRSESNPDDVLDYLKAHCPTLIDGHLFGGPAAITTAAEATMEKAASECATNQDFAVTPQESVTLTALTGASEGTGDDRQYTVSGLTAGTTYTVALLPAANVRLGADGQTTFKDSAGTNGQADDLGDAATA